MSVLQGLRRACQMHPHGAATIDDGRRRTWLEFRDRVARFAGALRAAGVQPGDRVAILSLNRDVYLEYFYAVPWAGALVVPLNTRLAAPELVAIINDSGAVGLLIDDTFNAMLPALIPGLSSVRNIWVAGTGGMPVGATSLNAAIDAADAIEAADAAAHDLLPVCIQPPRSASVVSVGWFQTAATWTTKDSCSSSIASSDSITPLDAAVVPPV
jgi:acyl-CoA synthetase (AMP-forming)/AMP-acid ligase II